MATSDEREPRGSTPVSRPDLLALEVHRAAVTMDAVQAGPAPQHRALPVPGASRPIAEAPGLSSARAASSPTSENPRAAAPLAGAMIGRYEIIRPLAFGGMGQVLLSRDTRLGRLAALKLLIMSQGAEQAARFLAEAFATARLNHENIVVIYEVGEHEGHPFMALEYLKGQTLRQWIDERKAKKGDAGLLVPPRTAIELMLPVVRALVHAHERGIAHRDLKPENVMLTDAGTLKVLDFGIAKILAEAEDARISLESIPPDLLLTQTGAALGTILYMAPSSGASMSSTTAPISGPRA